MFKLNLRDELVPWSQLKSPYVHIQKGQLGSNKINWNCTCNVHALCNMAESSGWILPTDPNYKRSPDAFANFIVTECLKENNWFKSRMPALWKDWYEGNPKAYSPLELHEVLAHYFNEWVGCSKADTFRINMSLVDLIIQLYENRSAVATSVAWADLLGHIITLVGFEATSEEEVQGLVSGNTTLKPSNIIKSLIWDDPYGYLDYKINKYDRSKGGNDVSAPLDFIWSHMKNIKDPNKKYGHFLTKPVSRV